ncbi:hypothetical protein BBC0178_020840 [Bartonella apihabitans]|uniref:Uncharacterized protein n=1 Tax=Bartonella apihabitans TaxID=2750929 RepID=A0A1U9MDV5_9HYPH|nr:hypothetical protein BBC0178_020840 [Bartonella apihabitans]
MAAYRAAHERFGKWQRKDGSQINAQSGNLLFSDWIIAVFRGDILMRYCIYCVELDCLAHLIGNNYFCLLAYRRARGVFIGRIISAKRRKIYQQQMDDERFNLVAASLVAAVPAILKNKKTLVLAVPLIGLAALMFWNKDKNSKS